MGVSFKHTILGLLRCSLIDQRFRALAMLVRLPPFHMCPAGYPAPWEQPRWTSRGHERLGLMTVPPERGNLKLSSQTQHGRVFFLRCIICMTTEKTYTLLLASKYSQLTQHAAHLSPERKNERARERKRAGEDGDLGLAFNEMENSRKSVSTPHSAVSKLHYTLSAWFWWGDSRMCVCYVWETDKLFFHNNIGGCLWLRLLSMWNRDQWAISVCVCVCEGGQCCKCFFILHLTTRSNGPSSGPVWFCREVVKSILISDTCLKCEVVHLTHTHTHTHTNTECPLGKL